MSDYLEQWNQAAFENEQLRERIAELETAQEQRPVKCAAVKIGDEVYTGKNHGAIIRRIISEFGEQKLYQEQQGFVDLDGKFLTRKEAYESAVAHGQIDDDENIPALISEMLPYYFRNAEKSLRKENERLERRIAELEGIIKHRERDECCQDYKNKLLNRIAELKAAQQWHDASEPPKDMQRVQIKTDGHIMNGIYVHSVAGYAVTFCDQRYIIARIAVDGWRDLPPMQETTDLSKVIGSMPDLPDGFPRPEADA